jgi:NADPH-dependent glutamate synthase beta chain and related oxidoreductases
MNVIRFLEECKAGTLAPLGENVIVIGGGNTAMDAARAAKREKGVKHVRLVYRRTARWMPADEEELQLAREDGVEFCELLAPVTFENGALLCNVMRLGEPDASGRRSPVETGEQISLPCDTLIAAVGEKIEVDLFTDNGIALTARGKAETDANLMTSRPHVYVVGDCNRGPATVVEGIADARTVADAIVGAYHYEICACGDTTEAACHEKHGILKDYEQAEKERARCLSCGTVCECCVQVCPNRANVAIRVPGKAKPQILHVDRMCNECGNCLVFCPYDSKPYKEKFTLFSTEAEFDGSENKGFLPLHDRVVKLRLDGVKIVDLDRDAIDPDAKAIIETVLNDYCYLIG